MRLTAISIDEYESSSSMRRFNFLFDNYAVMEPLISEYRERLIDEVMEQKAGNRKDEDEGLGVRIQVAFVRNNDPTATDAMSRMAVGKAIDRGFLDEDFFDGTDERDELIRKVTCYHMVSAGYERFGKTLKTMRENEQRILLPYVMKRKTITELSDELGISYDGIAKKLLRMKRKMMVKVEPERPLTERSNDEGNKKG